MKLPIQHRIPAAFLALVCVFPLGYCVATLAGGTFVSASTVALGVFSGVFLAAAIALFSGVAWARSLAFWLCVVALATCVASCWRLLSELQTPRPNVALFWGFAPGHGTTYSALAVSAFGVLFFLGYLVWLLQLRRLLQ